MPGWVGVGSRVVEKTAGETKKKITRKERNSSHQGLSLFFKKICSFSKSRPLKNSIPGLYDHQGYFRKVLIIRSWDRFGQTPKFLFHLELNPTGQGNLGYVDSMNLNVSRAASNFCIQVYLLEPKQWCRSNPRTSQTAQRVLGILEHFTF